MNLTFPIIKTLWVLSIPKDSKLFVKEGDEVNIDSLIFKKEDPPLLEVKIAQVLGVPASETANFLKVSPQGEIEAGTVLAQGSGLFRKTILSPIKGKLMKIDLEQGSIFLSPASSNKKAKGLMSPVKAKAIKVKEGKIFLEFRAIGIKAEKKMGNKKIWGKIYSIKEPSYLSLNKEVRNKILLFPALEPVYLKKASALGVKGGLYLNEVGLAWHDKDNFLLPVLIFQKSKEEVEEIREIIANNLGKKLFLDTISGMLLIPVN